jgi:rhomboid protease GluP
VDTVIAVFWFLVLSCVTGLVVVTVRFRFSAPGWVAVYSGILLVAALGWWWHKDGLIYAGLALWLMLVLLPALISRVYYRAILQQRYAVAYRLARIASWLHPADGWRQQPDFVRAFGLAHRGDFSAAKELLQRHQGTPSLVSLTAAVNLYRLTHEWEELLAQHQSELERHPQFLPVLLRAHGETGDLSGLAGAYDRNKHRIARLVPAVLRD